MHAPNTVRIRIFDAHKTIDEISRYLAWRSAQTIRKIERSVARAHVVFHYRYYSERTDSYRFAPLT